MVMRNIYKPQTVINFDDYEYSSTSDTESSSLGQQEDTLTISKFDGRNQDVGQWLQEYREFSEKKGWDKVERLNLVELYLDGKASDWYIEVEFILDDYAQFEAAVSQRFRGYNVAAAVYYHRQEGQEKTPTVRAKSLRASSGNRFEQDLINFSQDPVRVSSSSPTSESSWTASNWAIFAAYHSGLTNKEPDLFELPPKQCEKLSWSKTTTSLHMVRKIKQSPPSTAITGAFSLFCLKSACFMSRELTVQYQENELFDCPFSDALDEYLTTQFTVDGKLCYYQIALIGHMLLFHLPGKIFDFVDNFRKKLGAQSIFHEGFRENSALTPTQTLDLQKFRRCDARNGRICASLMIHFLIMCTKNLPLPNIDYLNEHTYELTTQQKNSLRVYKK